MDFHQKAACCIWVICIGAALCVEIQDDWIDPLDPLSHDPSKIEKDYKKYMDSKNQRDLTKDADSNKEQSDISPAGENDLNQNPCVDKENEIKELRQYIEKQPACEIEFFKQFVARLVLGLRREHWDEVSNLSHFQIDVSITDDEMLILDGFSKNSGGSYLVDAHSVLSNMIKRIKQVHVHEGAVTDWRFWISSIWQVATAIALLSLAVSIQWRIGIPWTRLLGSSVIVMFIISVAWNWWHLYQMSMAANMANTLENVPIECTPEKMSFFESLKSGFTIRDKCKEYYQNKHVNPWAEVPPTRAFVVTLTKFFLEPAEYLGRAFGKLILGCVQDLPVQLWPVAICLLVVVLLLVLIMGFRYKIKLFYLFGLEPAQPADKNTIKMIEKLDKKINKILEEFVPRINAVEEQVGQPQMSLPSLRRREVISSERMPGISGSDHACNHGSNHDAVCVGSQHTYTVGSRSEIQASEHAIDDRICGVSTILAQEHSQSVASNPDESRKSPNGKSRKKKRHTGRGPSDSSIAAQCGHTLEEDRMILKTQQTSGGDKPIRMTNPAGGTDVSIVSDESAGSDGSSAPASKDAAAAVILGFDTLAAGVTSSLSEVEEVGSQENKKSSLRPSESSDDSDLEIIEEEPENYQP